MIDENITSALPDYAVERELGHGGMGIVFLGRHMRLGRMVAIKELPPSFSADPEVRARFSTEARTLASLSHPHIVPIYDYVEREGLCLIVMEQLPGGTVWDRFTSTGLTPPTACAVALACCAALQHAHDKGVLHLDVKPDNLMFAPDKAIRVTDFGISRVLSGDQTLGTLDGQVLGTPAYMSPEQARGSELTLASDVYSTGVMLYELLSGHLPWVGAETATELLLKRLREDPRPLRSIAPQVPQGLADVVMKAIEREPEDRYKSAEEFGDRDRDRRARTRGARTGSTRPASRSSVPRGSRSRRARPAASRSSTTGARPDPRAPRAEPGPRRRRRSVPRSTASERRARDHGDARMADGARPTGRRRAGGGAAALPVPSTPSQPDDAARVRGRARRGQRAPHRGRRPQRHRSLGVRRRRRGLAIRTGPARLFALARALRHWRPSSPACSCSRRRSARGNAEARRRDDRRPDVIARRRFDVRPVEEPSGARARSGARAAHRPTRSR